MYSFDDLHGTERPDWRPSLAYWLGILKRDLPDDFRSANALASAMSFHFDVEEQAQDEIHIRTQKEILFHVFSPIAPVTLTEEWSPFPRCCQTLGAPLEHAKGKRGSAYAVFAAREPVEVASASVHEKHFDLLLDLSLSSAINAGHRLLLVAQPGWSYSHCKARPMAKHVKQIMINVGYAYTERISRPWWRFW